MLKKFGVNSTRAEKQGPTVKNAIKDGDDRFERVVVCSCGKKFVKSCPNKDVCDISVMQCPFCGANVK